MPEVNLDLLIPEDVEIAFRGETYVIPGDMDTEQIVTVFALFQALQKAQAEARGKQGQANVKRRMAEVKKQLLKLLQVRHPNLRELPFGDLAIAHIVGALLEQFGVGKGEEDPTPAPSRASPTRKPSSSAKPPRGRGTKSRSSSGR